MTTIYNRGFCLACGQSTNNWEEIGHARFYWCGCQEGRNELRNMHEEMIEDARHKAEKDDYGAYW